MNKTITLLLLFLCAVGSAGAVEGRGDRTTPQVRLLVTNPAPFVGEEVILSLEVRSVGRPGAISVRWPGLDSFASVDLPYPPPRRESDGTTTWLVQRAEKALTALAPGASTLTGAGVQAGSTFVPATGLALRPRALPGDGRPPDFTGAVGAAAMELAAAGRGSREIVLTLRGHAPLDAFPLPVPHLGTNERLVPLSDSVSGQAPGERQRTLRYLYLPGAGEEGELRFSLPLFQPQQQRYTRLEASIGQDSRLPPWLAGVPLLLITLLWLWLRRHRQRPRSLPGVLTWLVGQPVTGLSRRQLESLLAQQGLSPQLLAELRQHWLTEDAERFSPGADPTHLERHERAAGLVRQLRKAVDKRSRIS
ncbi:MAG: hypothetical protein E4H17_04610 [Gemmatimonadales bacterium]|nr:MAG: hypothetical protein E4H17_04610 [Gemmatimonadales bacterium]